MIPMSAMLVLCRRCFHGARNYFSADPPFLIGDGAGRGVALNKSGAVRAVPLAVLPPNLATDGAGRGVAPYKRRAVVTVLLAVLPPYLVGNSAGLGVPCYDFTAIRKKLFRGIISSGHAH